MPRYRVVNEAIATLSKKPTVEKVASLLDPVGDALEGRREIYDTLTGESLTGHPIHPALVHFPIGITMGAAVLEVVGWGRFKAATTALSGITVAMAVPTAVTGFADWTRGRPDARERRVGVLHAAVASAGTTLSVVSFILRLARAHGVARLFLFGAAGAYAVAGFIGGDLVYGKDLVPDLDEAEAEKTI